MRIVTCILTVFALAASIHAQTPFPTEPGNLTITGEWRPVESVAGHCVDVSGVVDGSRNGFPRIMAMDTLNDHVLRASQYVTYTYTVNQSTFPVTGSNTLYLFLGQKFPFSGTATVQGFLFSCAQHRIAEPADTLVVNLWAGNETTGLPAGTSLTFGRITTDRVDTNRTTPVFTYVPMNAPTTVNGSFVGTIQTRRGADHDDLLVIYSSMQGDGRGENRACCITVQNNQLIAANLSSLPLNFGGSPLDLDIMILPVIETGGTGVDARPAIIAGLEVRGIAPQPASLQTVLHLSCMRETRLSLDILDFSGRVVAHVGERDLAIGAHSVPLDVAGLATGSYFLRLMHADGGFALPLRVIR